MNGNSNNEVSEGFNIQNEPSNTLGLVFPQGYKVIGFKNDILINKTYFFLTNPLTHKSSIGFIENNVFDTFNQDTEASCPDCTQYNQLSEALENTIQQPSLEYVELVNDVCSGELNFDINFPLKKIEIKEEKLGTYLYWNDNRNPPRYMNVSDVSYLFTQEIPCGDDIQVDCLLVDKLLIFPKHNKIQIQAEQLQIGGNLKLGTYEFYVCYCDLMGNEITQYSTPTNPISIFDENNNILSQSELDTFTNFAIKLKVKNLDSKAFKYYKVVCVERNNVDNSQTAFIEGIHATTDDTIVYTHSGSSSDDFITRGNISIKKRIDFNKLNMIKPYYDRAESTMVSGNRLFHKGLTKKEEINLQPVVNLFGSLLEWQTVIANKDLYKTAMATTNNKGYMRNEVQAFGIRFFFKDGDYSAVFPLVGRPSVTSDLEVITDTNFQSLNANSKDCIINERNKKWQIFNTASFIDNCNDLDSGVETIETVKKSCTIEEVFIIPSNTTTFPITTEYTTLEEYVNSNPSENIPGISDYINDTYDVHCQPTFSSLCQPPVLIDEYNQIASVQNEQKTFIEKLVGEYVKSQPPQFCTPYKIDTTTGGNKRDTLFENSFMPCVGTDREVVYFRESSFNNEDCNYATTIPDNVTTGYSLFLNYVGDDVLANLLQTPTVTTTNFNFYGNLHKKAQFFKVDKKGRDKIVFEITKNSSCNDSDSLGTIGQLRYTFYDSCTTFNELIGGSIISTTSGVLTILDVSTFPSTFIVAIDAPIETDNIKVSCPAPSLKIVYKVNPPCGCFTLLTKDIEYKEIQVSWDSIILDKVEEYSSTCVFHLPTVDNCNPKAYSRGKMAFWESTELYPDNKQLYDSSFLKIKPSDLTELSSDKILSFEDYFKDGVDSEGNYILKPNTDLTCKPIRHPKLPDNTIAPFMYDQEGIQDFADSIIFPLGVTLDSKVVRTMLNVALNNNVITQKEYNNIEGYEILKGDNSIHKSVTANGIGSDMYNYNNIQGEKWWYANYPFNDLGKDKLNTIDNVNLIQHPSASTANYMFSVLSPDLFLTKPALPTEVVLAGYQMGSSNNSIVQVEEHPKFTILGHRARSLATTLAIAEFALEVVIKTSEFITQGGTGHTWVIAGFAGGTNAIGAGISMGAIIAFAVATAASGFLRMGNYRYQWLKTFRDLGTAYNFAYMTVGVGEHNRFLKVDTESNDYIRSLSLKKYLRDGMLSTVDENNGVRVNINNDLREDSVLISTGENYKFNYLPEYISYDNNNVNSNSSKVLSSEIGCSNTNSKRNIASPYLSLKNYIPDQWGTIDSIKWLTTNSIFKLDENTDCTTIFGGTVCITPFSVRKKVPIFRTTAMGLPDKLPFNYSDYNNIGFPKYFIDYEVDTEFNGFAIPFPDIDSNYKMDCLNEGFYVKPNSKIYLYSYGITNFLVESEINCHFRYSRKETNDWFYREGDNVNKVLQEKNLKIAEPNRFFYNNTYSFPVSNTPYKFLDYTYDKEVWRKRNLQPNGTIYSEQDYNENNLFDPWLVYKPVNWYEFSTRFGKLIDLKDIESQQFLARFENQLVLHNSSDALIKSIDSQNRETGTDGIFSERPLEFKSTDLGFAGTQHTEICSTPYGHFWIDAKRGKVFQIDQNGKSLEILSESVGKEPSGLQQWFREHLPFKILKYLPTIDIDNKFKGIGLNMWYDDRNNRIFITKRDYILQKGIDKNDFTFDKDSLKLFYQQEEVYFDNVELFKDVSWTISFKVGEGWNSYFTFYPDYSPFHNNFFQIGFNFGRDKETIWNHLLNNSSFQVFQGRLEPFQIEYATQSQNAIKILDVLSLGVEARRYQNNWDYSVWKDIGFNKLNIWNSTNNSGNLNLFAQKTLTDNRFYPKTNLNNTQDILFTSVDNRHIINSFYNRVVNQQNNIPMFLKDENNIFKEVSSRVVKFGGKRVLERLKGDSFLVNLTNDKESRFNITINNSINDETIK